MYVPGIIEGPRGQGRILEFRICTSGCRASLGFDVKGLGRRGAKKYVISPVDQTSPPKTTKSKARLRAPQLDASCSPI